MKPKHKIEAITKAYLAADAKLDGKLQAQAELARQFEADLKEQYDRQREANARRNQRRNVANRLLADRRQQQRFLQMTPQRRRIEHLKATVPAVQQAFDAGYAK